jgi:hypothetical protein
MNGTTIKILAIATAFVVLFALVTGCMMDLPKPKLARGEESVLLCQNLIANGNAEAAVGAKLNTEIAPSVPGWTRTSSFTTVQYYLPGSDYADPGIPMTSSPGPQSRGANLFAGGPDNELSTATQTINVSSMHTTIDDGSMVFTLDGYFGGFASQEDYAVLTLTYKDLEGQTLGVTTLGPVTTQDRAEVTGLLERSTTGRIPSGTRLIDVLLTMTRLSGHYNDGYADNLSLMLSEYGTRCM